MSGICAAFKDLGEIFCMFIRRKLYVFNQMNLNLRQIKIILKLAGETLCRHPAPTPPSPIFKCTSLKYFWFPSSDIGGRRHRYSLRQRRVCNSFLLLPLFSAGECLKRKTRESCSFLLAPICLSFLPASPTRYLRK